jgi:2,5-diketo-D-gluconate reductase A
VGQIAAVIPVRTLNSGHQITLLGLGTYPMDGAAGAAAMAQAIEAGYRLLDTAAKYGNEWAVGEAIKRSGVDRRELFVTSKLRGADHGRASTRAAVAASLDRLRLDYLDLYLIHWPLPRLGRYVESYAAMLDLAAEGVIRSVGVSNFKPAHIAALIEATGVTPAVDQIELSPALPRQATVGYLTQAGVLPQAWSPLGAAHQVTRSAVVTGMAQARGISPAQVVLRWAVQQGIAVIPKSSDPRRQRANLDIFRFSLSDAEMAALATLDLGEDAAVDSDLRVEF